MNTPLLSHRLDRAVVIQAKRETVFGFFSDSARWARWWGPGSTIEPHVGGKVVICQPGGDQVQGEVLEFKAPESLVFTYGFAGGRPIAPGGSRVSIRLEAITIGTRLSLTHEFSEPAIRDLFVQGWRYQLSVFVNAVSDEVFANSAAIADAWYDAWAETDDAARTAAFGRIAASSISFRDRFSLLSGLDDLTTHAGAAQRFMPGVRLHRSGEVRQCQGTVLSDWIARSPDGAELMRGTNVFMLGHDGLIQFATGFADTPRP